MDTATRTVTRRRFDCIEPGDLIRLTGTDSPERWVTVSIIRPDSVPGFVNIAYSDDEGRCGSTRRDAVEDDVAVAVAV